MFITKSNMSFWLIDNLCYKSPNNVIIAYQDSVRLSPIRIPYAYRLSGFRTPINKHMYALYDPIGNIPFSGKTENLDIPLESQKHYQEARHNTPLSLYAFYLVLQCEGI